MEHRIASIAMMESFSEHTNIELVSNFIEWLNREQFQVVVLLDESFNIVFASYSVKNILGYEYEEWLNRKIWDYIHPDEHDRFYQYLSSLNYKKKITETRLLNKSNQYVDCISYSGIIYDDRSNEKYYVVCIYDDSENKKAREALTNSEKLSTVGQLAASIVHEIRNPLTSIKGFLQLLKNSDREIQDEYIRVMTDSLEKIESITTELLYISRPSTNQVKEEDIISIVNEVCILMRSSATMSNIKLVFNSELNQYTIKCDRSQIKQVLINLIKNAIEAMPNGGKIQINVYKKEQLIIDVIDEGIGVPDEYKERLSDPFFTTKETGTGLGLMVTQNILKSHKCKLSIHDNEKQGSTFRITFPY